MAPPPVGPKRRGRGLKPTRKKCTAPAARLFGRTPGIKRPPTATAPSGTYRLCPSWKTTNNPVSCLPGYRWLISCGDQKALKALAMLDIRTVLFEGALIGIAVAVVMIYYSMVRKTYPGFHHWTIGFTLAGLGSFLIAFRGVIPDFISIILANASLVSMPFLLSIGLSRLSGVKWKFQKHFTALLILYITIISYATYIYPSVHIRILVFNSMYIILLLESLRITIQHLPIRLGSQDYLLILVIVAIILFVALRLIEAVMKGENIFFLENTDSVQSILILSSIVFTILAMISLIILNAHLIEIELKEANKKVELLANTDELTDLFNRRYFNKALQYEYKRLKRSSQPLSLIMADIDYFKEYNDTYGHQEGDNCIKRVAEVFKNAATRVSDIAVRYGGEEFILLLPNTDNTGATTVANTLFELLQETAILHPASIAGEYVTISAGVATIIPDEKTTEDLIINMADKALYASKLHGKNQFTHFSSDQCPIPRTLEA
ncbi:MAG: diguanylate cyclase [Desulfovibrio sp.]|nr:diguanylate cyclase [Desulfovibrio sp.]